MSESATDRVLELALQRLDDCLAKAPSLRALVRPWLRMHGARIHHAGFVPIFELPRWAQISVRGSVDADRDAELTYSTLCGYLFIRLIDDIVDDQNESARLGALALGVFDYEFLRAYRSFFSDDHAFWQQFEQHWRWSLDMTAEDVAADVTNREQFKQVAAGKLGAVRIPVTAACLLADRNDAVDAWLTLCDAVSRLYQFADDITDWQADLAAGRNSWLLSEADSQRACNESISAWMLRSGYTWSFARLDEWTAEAVAAANTVESAEAREHVTSFRDAMHRKLRELEPALAKLADLASALDSA